MTLQRRTHFTKSGDGSHPPSSTPPPPPPVTTNGDSAHDSHHEHSHSNSLFHSHTHEEGGHSHGAEQIVQALQGTGDRGSRITLIGLFANIALLAVKGAGGVYFHSASLLADAGHSASDLIGDFVTLVCWKLSRKPPSARYPFTFAKFETLGSSTLSILLIGGALGIGFHSAHLLTEALSTTAATLPAGALQDTLQNISSVGHHIPSVGHSHGHNHDVGGALDPNAAWFAALSVLAKEWLFRITKKVADEESSPVLLANAYHHRSDAYSSIVALVAILGTHFFPALPLDPIAGIIVAIVVFKQGLGILMGSWGELTDASVSPKTRQSFLKVLDPLISTSDKGSSHIGHPSILAISHLRARRAGSLVFVDLTADVPSQLTIKDASSLEEKIAETLKTARKEVSEVRVKFQPVDV